MVYDRVITAMKEYTAPNVVTYNAKMYQYKCMCASLTEELQSLILEKVCIFIMSVVVIMCVHMYYRIIWSSV